MRGEGSTPSRAPRAAPDVPNHPNIVRASQCAMPRFPRSVVWLRQKVMPLAGKSNIARSRSNSTVGGLAGAPSRDARRPGVRTDPVRSVRRDPRAAAGEAGPQDGRDEIETCRRRIDTPIQSNNSWGYSLVTPRTVLVVDAPILVGNAGSTAQVGLGIYSGENVVLVNSTISFPRQSPHADTAGVVVLGASNTLAIRGTIAATFGVYAPVSVDVTVTAAGHVAGELAGIEVASGSVIVNHGTVSGVNAVNVAEEWQGADSTIVNFGRILGAAHGTGVRWLESGGSLKNYGIISGGYGIYGAADDHVVENHGMIEGLNPTFSALHFGDGNDVVFNTGTIAGAGDAVWLGGGQNRLENMGTIRAGSSAFAIRGGADADIVVNTGIIRGDIHLGGGDDVFDGSLGRLFGALFGGGGNDRLIGSDVADRIDGGTGDDVMQGGLGNDIYTVDSAADVVVEFDGEGTDTVFAHVSYTLPDAVENLFIFGGTGQGNALANIITGSMFAETLAGHAGNDTLIGNDGDDVLIGGHGADVQRGGAGNDRFEVSGSLGLGDTFDGGIGTLKVTGAASLVLTTFSAAASSIEMWSGNGKALRGTAGADTFDFRGLVAMTRLPSVDGGAGNDRITGSIFADTLYGGAGADALLGGRGADLLIGGAGADTLHGGAGRDRFVFLKPQDSTVAASGRDTILDFSRADRDRIDLSAIDASSKIAKDQRFAFIGTSAFSGKDGELRYHKQGGSTLVQGDINGDGVADFAIRIVGNINLKAADFIL
ncbi:MAG: calcium-binding protein [Rhizobiaceae bacterium]|nr:calcium-binding protein [Rhizobiaceae bacterium]